MLQNPQGRATQMTCQRPMCHLLALVFQISLSMYFHYFIECTFYGKLLRILCGKEKFIQFLNYPKEGTDVISCSLSMDNLTKIFYFFDFKLQRSDLCSGTRESGWLCHHQHQFGQVISYRISKCRVIAGDKCRLRQRAILEDLEKKTKTLLC